MQDELRWEEKRTRHPESGDSLSVQSPYEVKSPAAQSNGPSGRTKLTTHTHRIIQMCG